MLRRSLALALLLACAAPGFAQLLNPNPDWKEVEVPPPPRLRTTGLIPIELPRSNLRFGVDPDSVSVGDDGVVRYVVVAASTTGTVNAMYEGIRCASGEVKTYARHNPDSGWVPVSQADWAPIFNRAAARHSLAIARAGACNAGAPAGNAAQVVRALRAPPEAKYDQPR
jgi:hypothetical protein